MARIRGLYNFFDPLLTLVYPIPKPAMIPLFMIWLGIGDFSKITVIMMGVLFPSSSHRTMRSRRRRQSRLVRPVQRDKAQEDHLEGHSSDVASADRRQRQDRPGISFIVLISSELISSEKGLGFLTFSYGNLGSEDYMIGVIFFLGLAGFLAEMLHMFL